MRTFPIDNSPKSNKNKREFELECYSGLAFYGQKEKPVEHLVLTMDVSEHESNNYIEWCDKVNERILRILAKHTGQSFEKIKNDCAKDLFLTAEEALKYGLIDKLI